MEYCQVRLTVTADIRKRDVPSLILPTEPARHMLWVGPATRNVPSRIQIATEPVIPRVLTSRVVYVEGDQVRLSVAGNVPGRQPTALVLGAEPPRYPLHVCPATRRYDDGARRLAEEVIRSEEAVDILRGVIPIVSHVPCVVRVPDVERERHRIVAREVRIVDPHGQVSAVQVIPVRQYLVVLPHLQRVGRLDLNESKRTESSGVEVGLYLWPFLLDHYPRPAVGSESCAAHPRLVVW